MSEPRKSAAFGCGAVVDGALIRFLIKFSSFRFFGHVLRCSHIEATNVPVEAFVETERPKLLNSWALGQTGARAFNSPAPRLHVKQARGAPCRESLRDPARNSVRDKSGETRATDRRRVESESVVRHC